MLDLSRELLFQAGGLHGLASACPKSLQRPGVGEVKIATLLAAVEIACRMAAAHVPVQEPLSRPAEVARYIDLRYGRFGQEILGALYVKRPASADRRAGAISRHPPPGVGRAAGDPEGGAAARRRGAGDVPHPPEWRPRAVA